MNATDMIEQLIKFIKDHGDSPISILSNGKMLDISKIVYNPPVEKGMYSITKEFHFEYSHRLNMDYESACKNLHGHSAKIVVQIWTDKLDENGMIVDFTKLREIQTMIDNNFDHSIILNGKDEMVQVILDKGYKNFILYNNVDPTSEIMSRIIWDKIAHILNDLTICWNEMEVTFFETAKNCASYRSKAALMI